MARLSIWLIGVIACAQPPKTPTMSDGCKLAASRVARARALAEAGWIDRAAARLREANAACPSDSTARILAQTLGELGRSDELAAWMIKLPASDPARGFVADALEHVTSETVADLLASAQREHGAAARRLYDRALTRAELDARAIGTTAITEVSGAPMLAASSNGRWIAIDNAIVDTRTGQEIVHGGAAAVSFSPDEHYAIFGDANETTVIADLDAKAEIKRLPGTPHNVVFDPSSHVAFVWTIVDGAEVRSVIDLATHDANDDTSAAPPAKEWVFDARGRFVAWASKDGPVVRDLASRAFLKLPTGAAADEVELGGDVLAFNTHGNELDVRRLPGGASLLHVKHVESWALAGDGSRIAWSDVGGSRQSVHVRDLATGRDLPLIGALGDDGAQPGSLLGGACGGGRYQWHAVTATTLTGARSCELSDEITVDIASGHVTVVGSTPGDEVAAQHEVYDLCKRAGADCGAPESQLVPPVWNGTTILPFADGLATVDPTTGTRRAHLAESEYATADASGLVAGGHLAATDATGRTRVWDLATGVVVWRDRLRAEPVAVAAFSNDGELVTASPRATVRHWKLATGELVRTWSPTGCDVVALAIAPHGEAVVVCTYGDHLSVYREGAAAPIYTGPLPYHDKLALEVSGQALALHAHDETKGEHIVVVPLVSGGTSRTFPSPFEPAVMSFIGEHLAIVNREQAVVWNVRTNEQHTLPLGKGEHFEGAAALSPDASSLAIRVGDHVRIFPLTGSSTPITLDAPPKSDQLWWAGESLLVSNARVSLDSSYVAALRSKTPSVPALIPGAALAASNGLVAIATARGLELRVVADLAAVRTFTTIPGADEAISIAAGDPPRISGTGKAVELAACIVGDTPYPIAMCRGRYEP